MNINPKLVIIDSIQTMYSEEISAAAGSVSQVREITSQIMRVCKSRNITTIIIGHVTKDGNIAGPRVLEHMVDTVLYLEGERYFSYRILRGVKNRFGSTNEIGMFEMRGEGMCEISNPSDVLISERDDNPAGSCIVSCLEGTRSILVELQALTSQSVFGYPKRTANGVDFNRLALLIAVMEKRAGMNLGTQDVYLNVVGGLKISEPSIDLGILMVTASSYKNVPIDKDIVIMGEVGLTGEVRRINLIEKRLKEAEKMGLRTMVLTNALIGESSEAGNFMASIAAEIQASGQPIAPPCVVIATGEVSAKIPEQPKGIGGPGQELAAGFAIAARKLRGPCIASVDTEGTDGPTDSAGGLADSKTFWLSEEKGIDLYEALRNHAVYEALSPLNSEIITGNTGTNLCDLHIMYVPEGEV